MDVFQKKELAIVWTIPAGIRKLSKIKIFKMLILYVVDYAAWAHISE